MVELMIAMLVGLFLLGTLALVLSNNSRTRNEMEKSIRQIQNARYAIEVLTKDLSNAGFYGEAGLPITASPLPQPCPAAGALNGDVLAFPVQGADNLAAGPACLPDLLPGTDYVVVRRASTCSVGQADCDPFVAGVPHIQQPACTPGQTPLVSTALAALSGTTRQCIASQLAPIYRLFNRVYYVAANNNAGDGIPTLMRADLGGAGYGITPVAEGIQALHFEYGLDTDGDGEPDSYLLTNNSGALLAGGVALPDAQWRDVVAIRVHLLARNVDPTAGYTDTRTYRLGQQTIAPLNDAFKRQAYSTTVRLNNVAGPRESSP